MLHSPQILLPSRKAAVAAPAARSIITASTPKQYLTTTWGNAPTDATRATISYWQKFITVPGADGYAFTTATSSSVLFNHKYVSTRYSVIDDITPVYKVAGDTLFSPDNTTWHHICVQIDTNQATATNRVRIYADGTEITYSDQTEPSVGSNMQVTASGIASYIGEVSYQVGATTGIPDAKWAYFYLVTGQNPTPDYTAFTTGSAGAGNIHPKAYSGSFGNNGFLLNGAGGSLTDAGPNGIAWTAPNGITFDADLPT